MKQHFASALVALACLAPAEAWACRFVQLPETETVRMKAARETVRRASAIIVADVVRPYVSEERPALLRARRIIKGPRTRLFRVAGATSCDIQFGEKGDAGRVLLFGGPGIYQANMYPSSGEDIDRAIRQMSTRRR